VAGETGWSRALKVAGYAWLVFGTLASLLWLFYYRREAMPGATGIVCGLAGLVLSLSLGAMLNLMAQLSDHVRARRG
jgi:hypothetical protein